MSETDQNDAAQNDAENEGDQQATDKPKASDGLKADLAKERQKRHDEAERANAAEARVKELEREKLSETERAQAEFNDARTEATQLKAEVDRLNREMRRAQVAQEFNLPFNVARRLQGETEDEMRADAKELSETLNLNAGEQPPPKRPPNDAKKSASAKPDQGLSFNQALKVLKDGT